MSHLLLKRHFRQLFFHRRRDHDLQQSLPSAGFLQEDFFDENLKKPTPAGIKPRDFCFQIIRGKRTPLGFKIVLALPEDQIPYFLTAHGLTGYRPEEIRGLYLNFHYDGHHLQCITGTSLNTFTMDKSIEREWDQEVKTF